MRPELPSLKISPNTKHTLTSPDYYISKPSKTQPFLLSSLEKLKRVSQITRQSLSSTLDYLQKSSSSLSGSPSSQSSLLLPFHSNYIPLYQSPENPPTPSAHHRSLSPSSSLILPPSSAYIPLYQSPLISFTTPSSHCEASTPHSSILSHFHPHRIPLASSPSRITTTPSPPFDIIASPNSTSSQWSPVRERLDTPATGLGQDIDIIQENTSNTFEESIPTNRHIGSAPRTSHTDQSPPRTNISSIEETSRPRLSGEPIQDKPERFTRLVQEIFRVLTQGIDGCSQDEHAATLQEHLAAEGTNHYGLSTTYQDPAGRSAVEDALGLENTGDFPSNQGLPRRRYTNAQELELLFHGEEAGEAIPNICLHSHTPARYQPLIRYDIDTFLAFLTSFQALRRDFRYVPVLTTTYNIKTNLHIRRRIVFTIQGKLRSRNVMLKDIPHIYIGTVDQWKDCRLYLFFPKLYEEGKFNSLSSHQAQRLGNLLLRAIREQIPGDYFQHIPGSQSLAERNSRARAAEGVQDNMSGGKGSPEYVIPAEYLRDVWQGFVHLCHIDGSRDFLDAFIFTQAKGIKTSWKENLLATAIRSFREHIERTFDWAYVERALVDVGQETFPLEPTGIEEGYGNPQESCTLLFKSCCLESQARKLQEQFYPNSYSPEQFYHPGLLRDTGTMTIEYPQGSVCTEYDVVYFQAYISSKELFDAFKTFPFDKEELLDLTLDYGVFVANTKAENQHRKSWEARTRSWNESKRRCVEVLETEEKGLGTRIETRVGWEVLQALEQYALSYEVPSSSRPSLLQPLDSTWAISTITYLEYLRGTYQKYTSAIEIIRITSPRTGITLERTKLMWMLMLCLPVIASGNVTQVPGLWLDISSRSEKTVRGLGWSSTFLKYGYPWWSYIVDWERLRFYPEVTEEVRISGRSLKNWYKSSLQLIRDTNEALDMCIDLLQRFPHSSRVTRDLGQLMMHLGFRQFRLDSLRTVEADIRRGYKGQLSGDEISFSFSSLSEVLIEEPWLTQGHKTKLKNPHDLYEFIWGKGRQHNRKFFDSWAYRVALRKTHAILEEYPLLHRQWKEEHEAQFWKFHHVVLYPDTYAGCFKSTTKAGRRQWFAVRHVVGSVLWVGTNCKPQQSPVPPYPLLLAMDREELVKYFEDMVAHHP